MAGTGVVSRQINIYSAKADIQSLKNVKSQFRTLTKDIQANLDRLIIKPRVSRNIPKNLGGGGSGAGKGGAGIGATSNGDSGRKSRKSRKTDADDQARATRQEREFSQIRSQIIAKFMKSNRLVRGLTSQQRANLALTLREAKTRDELALAIIGERAALADAARMQRRLTREANMQNAAQRRANASLTQMATAYASAYTAAAAFRKIVDIGTTIDSIQKGFIAVTGSVKGARNEMAYVVKQADALGISLMDAGEGYKNLLAASMGKMSTENVRKVFSGVAFASHALGLNSDKQKLVFEAITQMMSKGRVQSEELKRQLGNTLPIAMQAMAKAAEKAGLIKGAPNEQKREQALLTLMKQGKVVSTKVLPEFGNELMDLVKKNKDLMEALEYDWAYNESTMKNAVTNFTDQIYVGLRPAMVNLFKNVTLLTKGNTTLAHSFGTTLAGAIWGFTYPVRMLAAVFEDLAHYTGVAYDAIMKFAGVSKKTSDVFSTIALKAVGAIGGLILFWKTLRRVQRMLSSIRTTANSARDALDRLNGAGSEGGEGGSGGSGGNQGESIWSRISSGARRVGGGIRSGAGSIMDLGERAAGSIRSGAGAGWDMLSNSMDVFSILRGLAGRASLPVAAYSGYKFGTKYGGEFGDWAYRQTHGIQTTSPDFSATNDKVLDAIANGFSSPFKVQLSIDTTGLEDVVDAKVAASHDQQYLGALSQLPQ